MDKIEIVGKIPTAETNPDIVYRLAWSLVIRKRREEYLRDIQEFLEEKKNGKS